MPEPDRPVVTRFAPSPTGYLHVGGARTALFNWLLARHAGGQFLLRIEDTDLARSTPQACAQLLQDLKWLGLFWDNADSLVYQSRRLDLYNAVLSGLMQRGLAYEAWETTDELAALRAEAERQKRTFLYRRRDYTADELSRFKSEGRKPVIRFAMPAKEQRFFDVIAGKEIVMPADEAQDFVIRKADGMPTYHFAVVVDDAEMKITHVLRGQEHTKNTFLHVALQGALGYPRPVFAHLSTIQNPDGSKMGKRDRDRKVREQTHNHLKNAKRTIEEVARQAGLDVTRVSEWLAKSKSQLDPAEHEKLMPVIGLRPGDLPEILVNDFRRNGYLPEALLNFLALLGWNPGDNREIMPIDEIVRSFSLERVSNANAKFDRSKLLAFNTQTAEATPTERLVVVFRDYLDVNPDSPLDIAHDEQLSRVLEMKKGFRLLREVDEASRFLFVDDDELRYDPDAIEKVLRKNEGQGAAVLRDLRGLFESPPAWKHDVLEQLVQRYCEQRQLGLGKVAQPIRVAVSGSTISPPIFQSLEFLGRDRTVARIERCLRMV